MLHTACVHAQCMHVMCGIGYLHPGGGREGAQTELHQERDFGARQNTDERREGGGRWHGPRRLQCFANCAEQTESFNDLVIIQVISIQGWIDLIIRDRRTILHPGRFLKNKANVSDFVSGQMKHSEKCVHFASRFICFRTRFMFNLFVSQAICLF